MGKVNVIATRDHLESLTSATPLLGLAEIIWNGFDAGADQVQVFIELNKIDGIKLIRIRDNGCGIDREKVKTFFGSLGESWKKTQNRQNGRAIHGKNGKGRFKAFALGEYVEWNTNYQLDGKVYSYRIQGNAKKLDNFEISDSVETGTASVGTEVVIDNLKSDFHSLRKDTASLKLTKIFAPYLTEYPVLKLEYDGITIDPKSVQTHCAEYHLGDVGLGDGRKTPVAISIIEWNITTDHVLHLCDARGIALHERQVGPQISAHGFNFTAYIKSDHFRELDKSNLLALADLHPDVQAIEKVAKNKLKEHFRGRLLERQGKVVDQWKKERIYPYEDKSSLDPVEAAERQVFDILAVNVKSYLPSFEDADEKSKRFTFRLMAQAIRENPDSLQKIIGEVLGLKRETQDDLAELLQKTTLSSIISSAKIVANRLDFLNGLETLLFDKENKKKLLERDQLHKILENEAWLFHEEFALAGSEQRLEEVLNKHLGKLGKREDDIEPVKVGEGKTGRVDLLLHKVTQPHPGEYDYLIVELKRPSKKIDAEVLTQIKTYALAVAGDERFRDVPICWRFMAISNDLDAFAKSEANQRQRPKGLVSDIADSNITVWAKSWADVINDARARLHFVKEQLDYQADHDSANAYLKKTHAKFIPSAETASDESGEGAI